MKKLEKYCMLGVIAHDPREGLMQEQAFRDYLVARGLAQEQVEAQVAFVDAMETRLKEKAPSWTFEDLNHRSVQEVVDEMIDRDENTVENLQALLHYAKVINNDDMFVAIFQMLDGYEAMEGLYNRLADVVGEDLRDCVFEGMPLPPLGLSRREKSRYTYRIMARMEEIFGESISRDILDNSLRYLPDAYFGDARMDYYENCEGDIDRYLVLKGQRFIDKLRDYQMRKELFFGQEITDAVIAFVEASPEIGGGIRNGNVIYETKIPYNTKAFLVETDPNKKRYQYCHCPWAKESLRKGTLTVSATFCQCSAGFHKRPYEVIFSQPLKAEVLQSVLRGDPVCRFAIHLPDRGG